MTTYYEDLEQPVTQATAIAYVLTAVPIYPWPSHEVVNGIPLVFLCTANLHNDYVESTGKCDVYYNPSADTIVRVVGRGSGNVYRRLWPRVTCTDR